MSHLLIARSKVILTTNTIRWDKTYYRLEPCFGILAEHNIHIADLIQFPSLVTHSWERDGNREGSSDGA